MVWMQRICPPARGGSGNATFDNVPGGTTPPRRLFPAALMSDSRAPSNALLKHSQGKQKSPQGKQRTLLSVTSTLEHGKRHGLG